MYKVEADEYRYKVMAEFDSIEDATDFCLDSNMILTLTYGEIVEQWNCGKRIYSGPKSDSDKTARGADVRRDDLVRDMDIDNSF